MFESSLIDLEAKKQPKRRRWLSLPLAIVLHLVGLTAFAFASYWSVGAVQEPSTVQAYVEVLLPPPPPAGGGGHPKPPTPVPHPQSTPTPPSTPVQPQTVRDLKPATDTPVPSNEAPTGPSTEGPASDTPGPGGPLGLGLGPTGPTGPGVEPAVEDSLPLRLTAEMSRPVPLHPIQPRYTEVARRAGVQGTVIVEAIIDERGNATQVHILRGLPMGLDRAAMDAIQQTLFKPAMMGSRPVKVYYTLTVTFTIQR